MKYCLNCSSNKIDLVAFCENPAKNKYRCRSCGRIWEEKFKTEHIMNFNNKFKSIINEKKENA